MSDLIDQIQQAQRDAGEAVVVAHLERQGLVPPSTKPTEAALADAHSRQLLLRCLQVLSTLEGEDTTEQEMLDALTGDIKQAVGIVPLVRGGLI